MRRVLKIYLEKPELAGVVLLVVLALVFQVRSNGVFLSPENMRGVLGLLPGGGAGRDRRHHPDDLRRVRPFGRLGLRADADVVRHHAERRRALRRRPCLLGLALCAVVGFINGYVTVKFAIPSFITTLGMLFMARSLTVVISGGFPPLLPQVPSWIFTQYVGPGGLIRMSFIWFVGIALLADRDAVADQFRQLDQVDRRLPRGGGLDGHSGQPREDHLLHAVLDAGGLRRPDPGAAAELAAALDRRRAWSFRRSPPR